MKHRKVKTVAVWNNKEYDLIRSSRRSFALEINDKAMLVVRAPLRMKDDEINTHLHHYDGWIQKKIQQSSTKLQEVTPVTFTDGAKIIFMGEHYPLSITSTPKPFFNFENKLFTLDSEKKAKGFQYLERWYRVQAREVCVSMSEDLAKKMGVSFKNIKINGSKHRWGSCGSGGNINFSWKLVMAPLSVIEYVVIHELSHLSHMNHSNLFWRNIERYMPDYKIHKKWLKDNGHTLVI